MQKKLLLVLLCASSARCALENGVPVKDFLGNFLPFKIVCRDNTWDFGRRERLEQFVIQKKEYTQEEWKQFEQEFYAEDIGANPELLLLAIKYSRIDVLDFWQKRGLDIEACYRELVEKKPESLFHYLIEEGFLTKENITEFETLSALFPNELDKVNESGETLIHVAVEKNWHCLAEKARNKGAFIDTQNKDGDTAVHTAVRCLDEKFLVWLIENGAELDIENNKEKTAWDLLNEQNKSCSKQPNSFDLDDQAARLLQCRKVHVLMIAYNRFVGKQQKESVEKNINKFIEKKKEELDQKKKELDEQKVKLEKEIQELQESNRKEEEQAQSTIHILQEKLREFEKSNDLN